MTHKRKQTTFIVIGILFAIIVILMIVTGIMYYSVMNKHVDTFQNARGIADFSDYEELEREEASFTSDEGNRLQGYFYRNKDRENDKGVIIVNNGFGAGHEAMFGEIDALTKEGYLVYGFDKTGYDASEGKGIGSLSQGVHDLASAIDFVSESEQAAGKDIILYGRSWGAYCALAVLNDTDKVSAVVAMSAFNKTSDMMASEVKRMCGGFGEIFTPFCYLFDWMNEEHITALSGMEHSDARILIMHSKDDKTVDFKRSYEVFQKICGNQNRIEFVLYTDKDHSIIKSYESDQYNEQMDHDLQIFAEENGGKMTEELWETFLSRYDLKKCSKPDSQVLEVIFHFLKEEENETQNK